jgi:hypothetical protein
MSAVSLSGSSLLGGTSTSGSSVVRSAVLMGQGLRVDVRRLCLVGLRRTWWCGIGIDINFLGDCTKDVGAVRARGLRVKLPFSIASPSAAAGAEVSGSRIRDAAMLSVLSADKTSLAKGDG